MSRDDVFGQREHFRLPLSVWVSYVVKEPSRLLNNTEEATGKPQSTAAGVCDEAMSAR